jgi:hypothetical protein
MLRYAYLGAVHIKAKDGEMGLTMLQLLKIVV